MSIRVPYDTVKSTVLQAFLNLGLSADQAERCAAIHTESSLEGIESHGLNRVPRFAEYVQKGWVDIHAQPELVGAKGAVENYDGHLGIGVLNATFCMDRAVALAKEHGIGSLVVGEPIADDEDTKPVLLREIRCFRGLIDGGDGYGNRRLRGYLP